LNAFLAWFDSNPVTCFQRVHRVTLRWENPMPQSFFLKTVTSWNAPLNTLAWRCETEFPLEIA